MIDTRVFGYWIVNPRSRMSCMNTLSWLRCSLPIGITWYACSLASRSDFSSRMTAMRFTKLRRGRKTAGANRELAYNVALNPGRIL
jgi:hypothetical protein